MGRSQVLRNQRLGGRTGRGRTNTSSSSGNNSKTNRAHPPESRNSNSTQGWRQYPNSNVDRDTGKDDETTFMSAAASAQQDLDEQFLALEAHGNYANYQVSSEDDKYMFMTITTTAAAATLDIQKVNRGLSNLTLHELLGLPPHLTETLETASSVARSRAAAAAAADIVGITSDLGDCKVDGGIQSPPHNATQAVVSSDITEETTPLTNTIPTSNDVIEDMDDDDMESWLDSVIS